MSFDDVTWSDLSTPLKVGVFGGWVVAFIVGFWIASFVAGFLTGFLSVI